MRHKARSYSLQALYLSEMINSKSMIHCDKFFQQLVSQKNTIDFARTLVKGTLENRKQIDRKLRRNLDRWKLNRLSVLVRNILRLATFEMCYLKESSHQIIINEAIELCKDFVDDNSHGLINSVLQKLYNSNEGSVLNLRTKSKLANKSKKIQNNIYITN